MKSPSIWSIWTEQYKTLTRLSIKMTAKIRVTKSRTVRTSCAGAVWRKSRRMRWRLSGWRTSRGPARAYLPSPSDSAWAARKYTSGLGTRRRRRRTPDQMASSNLIKALFHRKLTQSWCQYRWLRCRTGRVLSRRRPRPLRTASESRWPSKKVVKKSTMIKTVPILTASKLIKSE